VAWGRCESDRCHGLAEVLALCYWLEHGLVMRCRQLMCRFMQQPRSEVEASHAAQKKSLEEELTSLAKKVSLSLDFPRPSRYSVMLANASQEPSSTSRGRDDACRESNLTSRASTWKSNSTRPTAN
jgi:hypothetical protein